MGNQNDDKYKNSLKQIGNETLNSLEPIIRKVATNMIELTKDIFNDALDSAFKGKKNEKR